MHNEAMFLDPDPAQSSQPIQEWRPSETRTCNRAIDKVIDPIARRILGFEPEDDTAFGFYRPATDGKRGRYAE